MPPPTPSFGFSRPEFRASTLSGTVELYHRHVFLCYKNPRVWPPRIEAAEFDRLPRLLSAAVTARKTDLKKQTRLTICEGHDGTETSNGDVLIFPDMILYRRLTHFDVDTFVEEVLVKDSEWLPGTPERFREEIGLRGLQGKVSVNPCSHVGGHTYAGNVIIFGPDFTGAISGHWYGYVAPDDVPLLLDQHIGEGKIVDWLWRGQMGLSEEEQKRLHEQRFQMVDCTSTEKSKESGDQLLASSKMEMPENIDESFSCCQEGGNSTCCQEGGNSTCCQEGGNSGCCQQGLPAYEDYLDCMDKDGKVAVASRKIGKRYLTRTKSGKGAGWRKVCAMPTWWETWEREDTYATLAVVCAAASVAVAYSCYRQWI
ncbi:hypothetical protein MLD38_034288 [Melastoma candidum]|uniref:Uncharacterized protein n=1 Tax=Melastoma candidum TaxID=119954 RepID=A0ACB9M9G5_9MYRT|nr:hypothetical protein MLD38_034288 [Melastoma candidum]